MPPEIARGGWEVIRQNPTHAVDAYNLGTLIYEVFNGSFHGSDQLGQMQNIPSSMHQSYKRLINPNPKARMSVAQFMEQGRRMEGFFQTPLIQVTEDIESLGLKADAEREELLGSVLLSLGIFSANFRIGS
jgi:SCY1-like protein 1